MEKKSKNILLYIILIIVSLAIGVAAGCLITMSIGKQQIAKEENVVNAIGNENTTNTINNIVENNQKNTSEGKGLELVQFTIAKSEQTADGYKIYAHLLADEEAKITKEQYEDLINGGSIKFRGREYVYLRKDKKDGKIEWTHLKEKNTELPENMDVGPIALNPAYINDEKQDYYRIWQIAGKESILKDFKSDELVEFKVNDSTLIGTNFDEFSYVFEENKIYLHNHHDENGTALKDYSIAEYLKDGITLDAEGTDGECVGYFVNGELLAIQVRTPAP